MDEERKGRLVAALGFGGRARVLAVVVDGPAQVLARRHGLGPAAAQLAAEAMAAAVLLSAHVKGEERLTMEVVGERPRFDVVVDVNGDGTVRGRLRPAEIPPGGHFSGLLAVLKSLGRQELYRGIARVQDEGFEAALQRFLVESQQVDARVRVGARVEEGRVVAAVGLLVERLPDTEADDFRDTILPVIEGGLDALMTAFAFGRLGGAEVEVLGAIDLRFACTCSRERVLATLRALGATEILGILDDPGFAEVTCHFCNERYEVGPDELRAMLAEVEA